MRRPGGHSWNTYLGWVGSLRLIWGSGTHGYHLRMSGPQMGSRVSPIERLPQWWSRWWPPWDAPRHDVIKWKHFLRYWTFVRGIHRSPVNSPHKGQWRRTLMINLICARINGWINNCEAGDLRRHRLHQYVIVVKLHYVFSHCVCMLFLFGWPSCQRSDMI